MISSYLFKNVLFILDKVDPYVYELVSEHGNEDEELEKGPLISKNGKQFGGVDKSRAFQRKQEKSGEVAG